MANNMKICKYCRSEIDKKAKVCPHCQKKQGSGCGVIVFVFFIIFILFLIFSGALSGIIGGYKDASDNAKVRQEAQQYSESDYKAACKAVTYEEIARDKEGLKGQKVTFTGEIIQATSGTYRMNVTKGEYGHYSDTILFNIDESALTQNILEDDIVTIWGESQGQYTYESIMGSQVTVPRISVVYIENHGKEN